MAGGSVIDAGSGGGTSESAVRLATMPCMARANWTDVLKLEYEIEAEV